MKICYASRVRSEATSRVISSRFGRPAHHSERIFQSPRFIQTGLTILRFHKGVLTPYLQPHCGPWHHVQHVVHVHHMACIGIVNPETDNFWLKNGPQGRSLTPRGTPGAFLAALHRYIVHTLQRRRLSKQFKHLFSINPWWSNGYESGLSPRRSGFDSPLDLFPFTFQFLFIIGDRLLEQKCLRFLAFILYYKNARHQGTMRCFASTSSGYFVH